MTKESLKKNSIRMYILTIKVLINEKCINMVCIYHDKAFLLRTNKITRDDLC